MDRIGLNQIVETLHACIVACEDTVAACEFAANASIDGGHLRGAVRASRDCADIAQLCLRFMQRHAQLTPEVCELCTKACLNCAEECEKYTADHLSVCAEVCRRCAEACQAVVV